MTRTWGLAILAGLSLLTVNPCLAQSKTEEKEGPCLRYGVQWQTSLESALKQAAVNKKPVFYFRVLGEMTGFM